MGPEFLGAGLIVVKILLLRVGLACRRNKTDGCERKYRSMERRFHRVTPCAAGAAACDIYFERFERRIFVCVMIRRQNVSTIMTGEKRVAQPLAASSKWRRNFCRGGFGAVRAFARSQRRPAKTKSPLVSGPSSDFSIGKKIWSGRRGSNPRPRPWQG